MAYALTSTFRWSTIPRMNTTNCKDTGSAMRISRLLREIRASYVYADERERLLWERGLHAVRAVMGDCSSVCPICINEERHRARPVP